MSIITRKQIFYINSEQKLTETNSNFSIKLNNIDKNANFNNVVVLQAIIPKSYYLVTTGFNSFSLQEGEESVEILVPIGNYNKVTFKGTLKTLLNANSPNQFIYNITDDNIAFGPDTSKFTYTVYVNNNDIQPSIIVGTIMNAQFGFFPNTTNTFINNTLVSTRFINFSLENTLFIHSNICQNTTSDNVLQEIFTTRVPTASFIKYDCYQMEAYSKPFNNKSDFYNFYLTDENDIPIETNGINMEITIMIYEKNDVSDEIREYIEMNKIKNKIKLLQN